MDATSATPAHTRPSPLLPDLLRRLADDGHFPANLGAANPPAFDEALDDINWLTFDIVLRGDRYEPSRPLTRSSIAGLRGFAIAADRALNERKINP